MNWDFIIETLIKFLLTIGFVVILSIERERHSHPGGVVTHILVGLGSCLYSIISISFDKENSDPTRIAAQIVSGMGFLGSATVFKTDKYVKGINTAANLWIAAAVGMGIGLGFE
jgi:putative Mg2+ transporter-C (MgtC) family protein